MPVRWVRLSDIAQKGVDFYICAGCGAQEAFEDCFTTIPFSHGGLQMMQGYIHCQRCTQTEPMVAWKKAHAKEFPHEPAG